ncbi:hypothetical protein C2E23DRAFT_925964 [Lenzites betulinus]|nr:hypothetical protein C2E23DRAFT_925964 [Lenzites betulinus]
MPRATASGARSSLNDHRFPAFYACYLLKSVRTPRATATYIGSTPSPPRRIRQHNGEISQGAWKTKHNRPWVMQMIVHGFPSKLAALQFEWAWQHPYISRHLRDDDGKAMFNSSGKFKYLNTNVKVARSMVSSHPYNTWPLGVKIFTEEVAKIWNSSAKETPLPEGLEVSLELEGVDGKSGKPGSGRTAPIDVVDTVFTDAHLRKASSVFTSGSRLRCSVCNEGIPHEADSLSVTLCPAGGCKAVTHLSCLSGDFLARAPTSSSNIIPRGGTCNQCHSYVLWGDVIRGCYRRHQGGVALEQDLADEDDQEDRLGQLFSDGEEDPLPEAEGSAKRAPKTKAKAKRPAQPKVKPKRPRGRPPLSASKPASFSTAASPHASSDEREHFDLDAISSCDEETSDSDDANNLPWSRRPAQAKPSASLQPKPRPGSSSRFPGASADEMADPQPVLVVDRSTAAAAIHRAVVVSHDEASCAARAPVVEDYGSSRAPGIISLQAPRFVSVSYNLLLFWFMSYSGAPFKNCQCIRRLSYR